MRCRATRAGCLPAIAGSRTALAGERSVDDERQALWRKVVDDDQDAEAAAGFCYLKLAPGFAGTLGGRLFEFGAWIIAERLHLSAILSVVAFAMTVARYVSERQSARDRVHSYAV